MKETNKSVMGTYVYTDKGNYLVSTIYRRSSAELNPEGWYYEIFGWELNEDNSKGKWIIEDSAMYLEKAISVHNKYCSDLLVKSSK